MPRTLRARRVVASIGAFTVMLFAFSATTRAATPANEASADAGASWLETQLEPDGSFEQTSFAGFETTDAVLAIAEAAQTGSSWNTDQAYDAVTALHGSDSGNPTPIDYLVDLVDNATDPAVAAKNLVYVALPLGIDPTDFGGLDLVDEMGGCEGMTTLGFNGFLYLVLAQELQCGSAPPESLQVIRDGQQPNGGWNYANEPTLDAADNDTTGAAIQALVAAGATASDPNVRKALEFFAAQHQANGAWQFYDSDDVNSTAMAILGITAAGFDPATSCWRDTVAPELATSTYGPPDAWIRSQQADSGEIGSAGNTFATSQAVQGLLASWLPVERASAQTCTTTGPTPTISNTAPTPGGSFVVSGTGFMPDTSLTITLHSDPIVLGTVVTDDAGAYSTIVTIPAGVAPGFHELVVSGLGPDGQPREASIQITVLAATGSDGSDGGAVPRFTG